VCHSTVFEVLTAQRVRVVKESGSRFARMPNHAMRLHEWGTRFCVWAIGLDEALSERFPICFAKRQEFFES
jgi:hypothetical protein